MENQVISILLLLVSPIFSTFDSYGDDGGRFSRSTAVQEETFQFISFCHVRLKNPLNLG